MWNNFTEQLWLLVIFTRYRLSRENYITSQSDLFTLEKSFKYLGMFLDHKPTRDEHINMILNKAEKGLQNLTSR